MIGREIVKGMSLISDRNDRKIGREIVKGMLMGSATVSLEACLEDCPLLT